MKQKVQQNSAPTHSYITKLPSITFIQQKKGVKEKQLSGKFHSLKTLQRNGKCKLSEIQKFNQKQVRFSMKIIMQGHKSLGQHLQTEEEQNLLKY